MKRMAGIALVLMLALGFAASAGSNYELTGSAMVETGVSVTLDPGFVVVIPAGLELVPDTAENFFDIGVSQLILENTGDVLRVGFDADGELVDLTDEEKTIPYVIAEAEDGIADEALLPDPEADGAERLELDFDTTGVKTLQIGIDWSAARSGEYTSSITFDIAPYTPGEDDYQEIMPASEEEEPQEIMPASEEEEPQEIMPVSEDEGAAASAADGEQEAGA